MFVQSAIKANFSRMFVVAILLVAGQACTAQQKEQSLFVIKTPTFDTKDYGPKESAIRLAAVTFQDEETTPREDLEPDVPKELKESKDIKPFEEDPSDLDEDENDLFVEEDDEDFDQQPESTPMTTWNLKPMSSITASMRPVSGKSPEDQSWQLTSRQYMPHANSEKLFAWAAPDIRYNPLYFEDVALERYGQTRGFLRQPFVSGFHFLKSATFLPYYSLYDPVNSCDGPLGYCRPGTQVNCVESRHFFGNPFEGVSQVPRRSPGCARRR